MYLKKILIENVGPIGNLQVDLPFIEDKPLPLVLVGANGSGKSTVLSFIVNALIGYKQQVFNQAEVEQNRVFRVRSPRFIRAGFNWYHAHLEFENGLSLKEWSLDRPRLDFERDVSPLPSNESWKEICPDGTNHFGIEPSRNQFQTPDPRLTKLFKENVVLCFPSDRFELPDWVNDRSLADELRFPEPNTFEGETSRRILSRGLLRPTLEWLKAVVFDSRLSDWHPFQLPLPEGIPAGIPGFKAFVPVQSRNSRIIQECGKVLAYVLNADTDTVQWNFGDRNSGILGVTFIRNGATHVIPNLLGLSAGQATAFCLFANVIRDFDLAGAAFEKLADIRGIVLVDEIDLHLHVDLQHRVLPKLMSLFPKVQFIVTAHSPMFVMGMRETFSDPGFRVIELPTGNLIASEEFSEFSHALNVFVRSQRFDRVVLEHICRSEVPVVIVEGKSDKMHLETAWKKLFSDTPMPWRIESSGGVGDNPKNGSAGELRTMLRACAFQAQRPVVGIFDHDREGMAQYGSLLINDGFAVITEDLHAKHSTAPVHAVALPVPSNRKLFVGSDPKRCFLSVEHFYSDERLHEFNVADEPVVPDSKVFGIRSKADKTRFAKATADFDPSEFENFRLIFDRIRSLIGT